LRAAVGVVSFSRLGALDDMNVDLTEQLLKAKQKQQQQQAAAAAAAASAPSSSKQQPKQQPAQQQQPRQRSAAAAASPSYQYKDLPSKNEARRYACGYVDAAIIDTAGHVTCIGGAASAVACFRVELAVCPAAEQPPELMAYAAQPTPANACTERGSTTAPTAACVKLGAWMLPC
jgi:hypothetical protein